MFIKIRINFPKCLAIYLLRSEKISRKKSVLSKKKNKQIYEIKADFHAFLLKKEEDTKIIKADFHAFLLKKRKWPIHFP